MYRYRVMAFNEQTNTRWSPPTQAFAEITVIEPPPPPPPPGPVVDPFWTVFTPSADTRIVYVSSSEGNDGNDGLSEGAPKRTIAAGRALLRSGYPDWILFKCGDTFSEAGWEIGGYGGRSAAEPQLWSSYGQGPRPLITPIPGSGADGIRFNWSPSFVTVSGLHAKAVATGGGSGMSFIASSRPIADIVIEDCFIEGFKDNINIQGNASIQIGNFSFRRCIVVDAYPNGTSHAQGPFINYVNGLLIEECLFAHNGWKNADRSDATIFNHNLYISSGNSPNAVLRGNIIAQASSHGLQLRCGGTIQDNLFLLNPLSVQLGGGDPNPNTHTNGVTGTISNNVILQGVDINSSNPRGLGILCLNIGYAGAAIEGNIVANTDVASDVNSLALMMQVDNNSYGQGVGYNNVMVTQNIFYNWRGGVLLSGPSTTPPSPSTFNSVAGNVFAGNDVDVPAASGSGRPAMTLIFASQVSQISFQGNRYSSSLPEAQRLRYNNAAVGLSAWSSSTGDTGSFLQSRSYVDPTRSIAGYNAAFGRAATAEAFLAEARLQRRGYWRPEYTAAAANAYIREGFAAFP